jgi:glutathione S-transferase
MRELFITNKNYSSWSLRPWLLMTELRIDFAERLVPFGAHQGPEGFARFSPTGRVPVLREDELTVWDSLAIVDHLAEARPDVWPADRAARAWARSATAEMHAGFARVRDVCSMNCGIRVALHPQDAAFDAEWARIDALWCEGPRRFGGPFLAGERFSAVDAFYAPVAFRVQTYSPPLSAAAMAYARTLLALPGMQAWYAAALAETGRDEPHEAEARAAGRWLHDLRAQPAASNSAMGGR